MQNSRPDQLSRKPASIVTGIMPNQGYIPKPLDVLGVLRDVETSTNGEVKSQGQVLNLP